MTAPTGPTDLASFRLRSEASHLRGRRRYVGDSGHLLREPASLPDAASATDCMAASTRCDVRSLGENRAEVDKF